MGAVLPTTTAQGDVVTGLVKLTVDGVTYRVKGAIDYDLGLPMAEEIIGQDGIHGFKETPKVAYVECEVTDGYSYDLKQIINATNVTVVVALNNGKTVTFTNCRQTGEGKVNSEESALTLKWVSMNQGVETK